MTLFRRSIRTLVVASALAVILAACGGDDDTGTSAGTTEAEPEVDTSADESDDEAYPSGDDDNAPTPSDDCDQVDTDAITQITGGEIVEVKQIGVNDDYSHQLGDQEFEGTHNGGCNIDLSFSEFGPPELDVDLLKMDDGFYESYRTHAESEDGFESVDGIGDDAFRYSFGTSSPLVVDVGDQVLTVAFSRGGNEPDVATSELVALAELFLPAG